jgi:hypothetical protein
MSVYDDPEIVDAGETVFDDDRVGEVVGVVGEVNGESAAFG